MNKNMPVINRICGRRDDELNYQKHKLRLS